MKYQQPQKLKDIAAILDCKYVGDDDFPVLGHNEIHVVEPGDIVFVDHPKYYDKALQSAATIVLINKEVECPEGKALLISDQPFYDFNKLTKHFNPFLASSAAIDPSAIIGEGTIIQPNVVIGPNVKIGKDCIVHAGAVINYNCELGNNVIVHSNVVIGSEAFYYKKHAEGVEKLLSGGSVVIEDEVELGAGTTIDRGVSGITRVKKFTKIDNLCHIGHDTVVGEKCLLAAHTGIAGCSVVGNEVTMWGRVGVTSGITIGDKAVVLACSCVSKSLEGGKTYFGVPATEARVKWKEMAATSQLPEILRQLELNK
ncbi:MAG: UDP-3-O-(3-hydroxymyristoyl)glucosamine N-acyltransferase [Crocinitomicaceae bacterium]|nr:UDP-3-O-(3-hydroxymyristoyl)glucosamine N-acyltransferase [Crocinitomicaceae bacterium]|tara:strand:+ start:94 stop:1032 length:939 start_codon:yes stop_codon:yes gene_type:complete